MPFILLVACAAEVRKLEVSPRAITVAQTACEPAGVSLRDYVETAEGSRWSAACYGRFFLCETHGEAASCTVNEERSKQASASTDELLRRHNGCLSGKGQMCHALAEDYELGRNGIPPDRLAAIELYSYSCKYGFPRDCVRGQLLKKKR